MTLENTWMNTWPFWSCVHFPEASYLMPKGQRERQNSSLLGVALRVIQDPRCFQTLIPCWRGSGDFILPPLHNRSLQLCSAPCFSSCFSFTGRGIVRHFSWVFFCLWHVMCDAGPVCHPWGMCGPAGGGGRGGSRVDDSSEKGPTLCPPLRLGCNTVPVPFSDGRAPGATEMARGERRGVGRAARRTNSSGAITKGPGAARTPRAPTAISSPPWPRRRVLGASRCWPGVTARPVPGVPGSCPKQVVSTGGV